MFKASYLIKYYKYHFLHISLSSPLIYNKLSMSNYCSTVLKYLLYYCSTTAHTETPKQSVTGVSKQNKSHMMLISRLIKTLPAAGAAVQWKHRSIRRIKRPKESMLALLAQTQKWINVDGEMRSKWERERETEKEREREGGRGGETDWIPPATALFNSQRVDVTCWPHSGHTGHQNKCQQQTDRGKVWKEKRAREGRGWEKLETDKTTKRDQWVGTNSVIAAKRKKKKKRRVIQQDGERDGPEKRLLHGKNGNGVKESE